MDELNGRLAFSGEQIAEHLLLNPEQVNDAVEELESLGLVHTIAWMGAAPYNFGQVKPTPSLAFHLKDSGVLQYNPEDDVRAVAAAAAIVQEKHASGSSIQTITGLSPSRIKPGGVVSRGIQHRHRSEGHGNGTVRFWPGQLDWSYEAVCERELVRAAQQGSRADRWLAFARRGSSPPTLAE